MQHTCTRRGCHAVRVPGATSLFVFVIAVFGAGQALGVVGNPVALTEQAEAYELKGQYANAATARDRALNYAKRTLESLKSNNSAAAKRDRALAESLIAENRRWAAEDRAGGGKLVHVKEEMQLVASKLQPVKALESRYQQLKAKGAKKDAEAARQQAIAQRKAFIETLNQKISALNGMVNRKEKGWEARKIEADYYRGVLARWQWSLAMLSA